MPVNSDHREAVLGPGGCLATALADGDGVVLRVAGDCMEPEFDDQATVRLVQTRFYVPGDVVAFHDPQNNRLVVHRFLGYVWHRGEWKLMVKADRGVKPDPLVAKSCVLGKSIARDGEAYRVSPAKRLKAIGQYTACCMRFFIRRTFR